MTHKTRFFLSIVLTLTLLGIRVGGVLAAPATQNPAPVSGIIQSITLEADTVTGVTIVSVAVIDGNASLQSIRVSLETAIAQGLVVLNGDGKPDINNSALGKAVEIDPSSLIPAHEENEHPVANALATFFSDIDGITYETIMTIHEQGVGFGVIAQSLWLTTKLEGDAQIFEELIHARQTGDFSAFLLEDGSSPANWGQLKKAILEKDKKNGLGVVISHNHGNGNGNNPGNNGNGNNGGNNNGGGNDNGGGNGNGGGNNGEGNGNGGGNDNRDRGNGRDNTK
jgi:hypothetical protein